MEKEKIKTVEMVRRIRDAQHEQLKGRSWEDRVAFYQEQTDALHDKLKRRRDEGKGQGRG